MGRAPCCDKANVKRGPWSPEEDEKLKSYIEKHGTGGNWIALPQKIGLKRCGKSCRLRWLNYLRPNIKHGGFTEDEDNLICNLYVSIGSRWSIIAAQLPGRTDNDIKNYWNTRLKKKLLGKQRREQQARRENKPLENTKKSCHENYSMINNNECFSLLYHQPPPLSMVGAYRMQDKTTNSLVDVSTIFMPQFDQANLANNYVDHNNSQPKTENFESFRYNISDHHVPSTCCMAFLNTSCPPLSSDFNAINDVSSIDFQAFGEIPAEEIIYSSMPQNLDGVDSFSSLDLVNSSTNLGDKNPLFNNYPSALYNFEACQPKLMNQEWTYLDEHRLLGYSQ